MADQLAPAKEKSVKREAPWLIRTYSGYASATQSNALYRKNLARGQTGLSIAFDLPTQTGYDSDHLLARGEVGKVGVPVCHVGDMDTLLDGIPLDKMNTSMTINAPAAWMLSLYIAAAERRGVARDKLSGTTQNDIIKEYLSRGTYIFPPAPSMRLIADIIAFTYKEVPKWNPINVCSYHLQEAGATPEQELAFALANAVAVLDAVKASGQVPAHEFPQVVGRISFFCNAGIRFITELCKMRAFNDLWDEICQQRYGVDDPKLRRFRYGVQVNSLGLTEQQPENNVYRILLEMLAVVLSKDARARAVQLPAWNEALGLPRPWDQQWSLRFQQIVAYETDLLDFDDIFDGSRVIAEKVEQLKYQARDEARPHRRDGRGGDRRRVQLHEAPAGRVQRQAAGGDRERRADRRRRQQVHRGRAVAAGRPARRASSPSIRAPSRSRSPRSTPGGPARDAAKVKAALTALAVAAKEGRNIMEPSIACAHAGVTTGEWSGALREIFGEFRAPTGVSQAVVSGDLGTLKTVRARLETLTDKLGRRIKMLVGKPGLDGHSNGAEQIALRARDAGFEVVYEGIRLTPEQIVAAALEEGVHVVGLSILSGSHVPLVTEIMERMKAADLDDVPVVVGGIIPPEDAEKLVKVGVSRVYTPKDFDLNAIMADILTVVEETAKEAA